MILTKDREKFLNKVQRDFENRHGAEAWRELNRLLKFRNHHFGQRRIARVLGVNRWVVRYWIIRIKAGDKF